MSKALYDTMAFAMRYWFILIIALMLLTLVLVSRREYRERRAVMGEVSRYIGYLEITGGADDVLGERIGIMAENRVGSSHNCDIIISDPSVRKTHALIVKRGGEVLLVPMHNGDTRINNRRATRAHAIFTGDLVQFGDISARVFLKEPAGEEGGAGDDTTA